MDREAGGAKRRLRALMTKEVYQIIYDPSSILISIILPAILLFLYGFGVSLDLDHLRIGLVLEDTAPDARSFAAALTHSRYFDVKVVQDPRELTEDILSGAIRGYVVIPSYFSAFRYRKNGVAPLQIIADGSEPNTANFVQNYVSQTLTTWLKEQKVETDLIGLPRVSIQPRYWYNEELESRNFLVPGSLAIIMTLIGTLLTALVIAREWERGTMEALMSTPVTIVEILIGKLVPYYVLGMLSMTLCFFGAVYGYHIPFRGSWIALAFVTTCFLTTALGLGLLISTLAKNQFVAAQTSMVVAFLPSYILSGFIFEIASMPLPIHLLTYLIPARYFVTCLQTLFLVGDIWPLLIKNILPMLAIGAFFFMLTARISVKRLD